MKKHTLIIIVCVLMSINIKAQENFTWEKIDSVSKTKLQIYSDTKMFIAQEFKSANNVIQNDDRESGVILVKGTIVKHLQYNSGLAYCNYYYDFTVTFLMKDYKYKMSINNVYCSLTAGSGNLGYGKIQPFEGDFNGNAFSYNTTKQKAKELMISLKADLQKIVDSYDKFIKTPSKTENW